MADHPAIRPRSSSVVVSDIEEISGCFLVGTVLSAVAYGVSLLQAYMYFRNSNRDSKYLRCFVAIMFTLVTITMALNIEGLYEYFVTDFGNPFLLAKFPRTLELLDMLSVLIDTLTQCFFAYRLWALSKRNIVLVGSIVFVALCSFAAGMASWVILIASANPDIIIISLEMRTLWGLVSALSMVCDVLIMAGLCYYLHSSRTGFRSTNSIIDRLIIYAVNRGVLTAVCGAGWVITTIAFPRRFLDLPFGLLTQHLYVNTLLAMLNARRSLKRDGNNVEELDTQILARIAPTGGNRYRQSQAPARSESEERETAEVSPSAIQTVIDICADDKLAVPPV